MSQYHWKNVNRMALDEVQVELADIARKAGKISPELAKRERQLKKRLKQAAKTVH